MNKTFMTTKQAVCVLVMFIFGNTLMYSGSKVRQDTWIAVLGGLLMAAPMMLAYARTLKLYPGKNLYDIVVDVFGKVLGKIIVVFYIWYAVHMGAVLMRSFAEFINVTTMPETPKIVLTVFLFALGFWAVKSGMDVLGKWAKFALPIVFFAIVITIVISINFMDFNNLRPVAGSGVKPLLGSSFTIFAFPFAETVLLMTMFSSIRASKSPYKIYIYGALISTLVMLVVIIRNIVVLGFPSLELHYFASYTTVSVISLGDFFSRIEVLIGMAFLLDLFVKFGVCMFAASVGMAKLFNLSDYKVLAIPAALLMLALACIICGNTLEMYGWLDVNKYYAFPFQVVVPLIILVGAEIKCRRRKKASRSVEKTDSV